MPKILGLDWRRVLHRIFDTIYDDDFDSPIVEPILSYKPQKIVGQVITVAEHDQYSCPVIADHLSILELPPEQNLSGLVDSEGNAEAAMHEYELSAKLAPEVVELQFWAALGMYTNGREAEGLALFKDVFAKEDRWVDLIPRLAKVGLFPDDEAKIAEVQSQHTP